MTSSGMSQTVWADMGKGGDRKKCDMSVLRVHEENKWTKKYSMSWDGEQKEIMTHSDNWLKTAAK